MQNLYRKGIVFAIMFLFIWVGGIPGVGVNIGNNERVVISDNVDWWPMYHHDRYNSGYSTSDAPGTNDTLWIFKADNDSFFSPVVYDYKVYIVGASYDKLYCVNADNGHIIWSNATRDFLTSPAIAHDKVYVGANINGWECEMCCLDAQNGKLIWSYKVGCGPSSPTIAESKVYFGTSGAKVYCLDADNGDFIWSFETGEGVWSIPAVSEGKVYVGSDKVYCLDAEDGTEIWSYPTTSNAGSPAIADGKVYIGSDKVYCLDAEDGTEIWSYPIGELAYNSPVVADGKVYLCTTCSGTVYCLDAEGDGEGKTEKVWWYENNIGTTSSPAIANGKVYVSAGDVCCFGYQPPYTSISKPTNGIYFDNVQLSWQCRRTIILGSVDIEVDAYDHSGVNSVEFFINEESMFRDYIEPYNWTWDEICFGKFIVKAVVYDNAGNQNSEGIGVWKFF